MTFYILSNHLQSSGFYQNIVFWIANFFKSNEIDFSFRYKAKIIDLLLLTSSIKFWRHQ